MIRCGECRFWAKTGDITADRSEYPMGICLHGIYWYFPGECHLAPPGKDGWPPARDHEGCGQGEPQAAKARGET